MRVSVGRTRADSRGLERVQRSTWNISSDGRLSEAAWNSAGTLTTLRHPPPGVQKG